MAWGSVQFNKNIDSSYSIESVLTVIQQEFIAKIMERHFYKKRGLA